MRKATISILVFTFLSILLRPYSPHLEYAHNKEYIANNLCQNKAKPELKCEGKCHLSKQLKAQSERQEDQSTPLPPQITEVKQPFFTHQMPHLPQLTQHLIQLESTDFVPPLHTQISVTPTVPPPQHTKV